MRIRRFVIATAAFLAFPASALPQGIEIGPRGVQVDPYPRYRDPDYRGRSVARTDCDELRAACLHKDELGEQGRGNCNRYRRYCVNR
jgi:hypothetical protein